MTTPEFVRDRYMYCAAKLALAMQHGETEKSRLKLRDMEEWHRMNVITIEGYADDLADLLYVMGVQFKYNTSTDFVGAWIIPPQGLTETLGALHDETAAWLILDENGPALMYRVGERGLNDYIERWKEYWLDNPAPGVWPRVTKESSALWVPYAMRKLTPKEKRAARRRDNAGQRYIY